jgi:hypothetical protein
MMCWQSYIKTLFEIDFSVNILGYYAVLEHFQSPMGFYLGPSELIALP